jgi:outer membrane lipopolysaccharide assembly protein LptE/RlpB
MNMMHCMKYFIKAAWVLTGLVMVASGCGYRLEGGGHVSPGVTRVGVGVFENKTAQTHAGVDFTNALIREIQDRTDTEVVDPDHAAFLINGVIKGITFSTLSRSSTETVTERRVTAVVDVQLVAADKVVRWSVAGLSASESYVVAPDKIDDEAKIRFAIDVIAARIADRIVSQMAADF